MTRGRSSNGARTPQVRNEPGPEDGADVLRVRPQGALCNALNSISVNTSKYKVELVEKLEKTASIFGDNHVSPIHAFFLSRQYFLHRRGGSLEILNAEVGYILRGHGMIERRRQGNYFLTDGGRKFLLRMIKDDKAQEAQRHGL
jgi:hypothetical protein